MRNFGRSIAFGFASVVLAVFGVSTPAAADGPQAGTVTGETSLDATAGLKVGQPVIHKRGDGVKPPAELGNPSEWGVVKIEVNGSTGSFQALGNKCENVSRGIWCYGWDKIDPGKKCYSNYMASVKHKSTVRVKNVDYPTAWVGAGATSYAYAYSGLQYTCYSYYSNA
ncbi:hypothetical protein ACFQ7B_15020 [Streptomyces erythrochromogenes]|uniref:hypothetical protein n=1 Tax=Streptomyces erythrochromogenes TaxID=285574 RepID=UPI0036991771